MGKTMWEKLSCLTVGAACYKAMEPHGAFCRHSGSHNTVPCSGMLCGRRTSGFPRLRPHHGHTVILAFLLHLNVQVIES